MKTVLFCNLPYAFSILAPLATVLEEENDTYLWYLPTAIVKDFPYLDMPYTSNIKEIEDFQADAIFVPGNDVPYWLRGLKVQIFHGLAGEKKGHFRIRNYFDLYLTPGPYFTNKFKILSKKYKNFDVIETGWPKLDKLFTMPSNHIEKKTTLLKKYNVKHIILYSPTFSPSLQSAGQLVNSIEKLSQHKDILVIIKFHDKMSPTIIKNYENIKEEKLLISDTKDISALLHISDLMISDTSSVVYEYILLDKPVLTFNSHAKNLYWKNCIHAEDIYKDSLDILENDRYKEERHHIISTYHPYKDGKSALRMIEAVKTHLLENSVPNKRKLSFLRKWKLHSLYRK